MVSLDDIQEKVELAKAYYLELLEEDTSLLKEGSCRKNQPAIKCINRLVRALQWDIQDSVNTEYTQGIYKILLIKISPYSGSFLPYDPSVVVGPINVIVANDVLSMHKTQANLIDSDPPNGNWYLPFLSDSGTPFPNGYVPTYISVNGTTMTGWIYEATSNRIYGFANNDSQTIEVLVEYLA